MQDVKCPHCNRFLFQRAGTIVIEGLICPNSNCKARLNYKVIDDRMKDISHKFINPEKPPKERKI